MSTPIVHTTVRSLSRSREPRLVLASTRAARAVLDGGWWPRSRDPAAELPDLILALSTRYGPVRQVMLNATGWDSRFRRLAVGSTVVRMGWFATLDPALAIASTDRGDQIDLLVVAPETPEGIAYGAMRQAADPRNTVRAPAIVAVRSAVSVTAPPDERDRLSAWDNEGGRPGPEAVLVG